MKEQEQAIAQDIKAYAIGAGSILGFSLADISEVAQQIGVICGAILVFVTLMHRILLFYKDLKK
jgi:hypothetical protein